MNPKKCAVLRFARPSANLPSPVYFPDGQQIPYVDSHCDLMVTVDSQLKFHEHIRTVANKAGGLAHSFLKSTVCRSCGFMLFLLTTHIRPDIEYCSCLWHTGYLQDLRVLENVHRRWTKRVDGMIAYSPWTCILSKGGLFVLIWNSFGSCLMVNCAWVQMTCLTTLRSSGLEATALGFSPLTHTQTRENVFSLSGVSLWNSLPEDAVCAPNMAKFKKMIEVHAHDSLFRCDWEMQCWFCR